MTMLHSKSSGQREQGLIARLAPTIGLIANVAVVVGVILGLAQLYQAEWSEKRRIGIEATSELRSPKFLEAYTHIIDAAASGPDISQQGSVRDDLYYVVSTYDNIAALYRHDLAEKQVIAFEVGHGLKTLLPIMKASNYPPDRTDFERIVTDYEKSGGT